MEAKNKQRGWFMRDKLTKSFSQLTKRSSQAQGGSKVIRPNPSTQNGSVGIFTDQKYANPSSMQKVYSYVKPDSLRDPYGYVSGTNYGYGGDENVDMKAASYISYVRERFKVEKVDSDGRMYQEMY